ncbi:MULTISPECIES: VOC family protein [Sphingomonas]|uniref:Catechol 2,3-dioxygenase-like lactoylglutathione lyase family enzyme n=1 Tax=Sphingomonas leidyi TaxID=68569 RepID=A0A7X5ZWZ0_9SPHN|nr:MULTISPECIES: VOC family protein [Sphingomonas]MBN8810981.1 VOC family protein [Sphingomonas sp.]NIJ66284.1 catechol 2,3-dioxygenase-like lactoylglutathione lyase family enzyme [Sphingomonas leidyi]OJY54486.1 MAG: hypothetical protein BGP17_05445 [Sphingomonas sp. 67-41]
MDLPAFCPEIPVSDLPAALAYYRDRLGLAVDWSDRELGLAGVSRGATRAFLSSAAYRDPLGNRPPVVLWLNLANRAEIDALHAEWAAAGAAIDAPPAAKPYKLYEFFARDPDGNRLRIFYDFAWEERAAGSGAR